jgi:peptidyl-prolyl cis-trans isomerase SurA
MGFRNLLIGALACCVAVSVHGEYQELDGIIAVVDDDVVLASELLTRVKRVQDQLKDSDVQLPPEQVLLSQILERLILESIQLQQAARRGVQVDDESLTQAVAGFAEQNRMSLDEFRMALEQDGLSYREFREEIRAEMIISRLQRNLVNRRIVISDQDIQDLLGSPYYAQLLSDEYRVGHILLTVESGASEDVIVEAVRSAETMVAELRAGADFQQMAIARSSGARALEGGDLGWRKAAELPSVFAELVLPMLAGDTADPIRSASGVHVIQLLERRGAGTQKEHQTHARHILVKPSEIRTDAETEILIHDLHAQIVAGADFAAMAEANSEDPGSALNGGDLGWARSDQFAGAFASALDPLSVGELSAPFRTDFGWHVIEVLERRETDMSDEARENMALKILHQRRYDEVLQAWLKEIRDEAYVEMRLPS